jgi:threonine dehydratase
MMRIMLTPPTLADIYRARTRLTGLLPRTPLMAYPKLAHEYGCDLRVKHENHLPTGAFKVRGGLNLIGTLAEQSRDLKVITASTGNHGQSIALACRQHRVPCTIVVPEGNNPDKNAAMRAFGAEVIEFGRDFDESREEVERRVAAGGVRYVHSANEPLLIAGVGTYALEIFEDFPDVDVIYVAIGGGSGASGLVTVRNVLGSAARVIGVQAANADAFARSWRTGQRVVGSAANTFAEGVATRVTFDLPFGILSSTPGLDDVVTLSEDDLAEGVRLALHGTHNLAEGAGAAALMAAWTQRGQLAGKRVVCVMSGGNLNLPTLSRILSATAAPAGATTANATAASATAASTAASTATTSTAAPAARDTVAASRS